MQRRRTFAAGVRGDAALMVLSISLVSLAAPGDGTLAAAEKSAPAIAVDHLRVEHFDNPLGLGTRAPRFSWWMHGESRGLSQAEYQVQVARTADDLARGRRLVWDSTRVKSAESTYRCTRDLRSSRGSATTGAFAYGTLRAAHRPGAPPPGGRWDCWRRPTGRRSGSSPIHRTIPPCRNRRRCSGALSL